MIKLLRGSARAAVAASLCLGSALPAQEPPTHSEIVAQPEAVDAAFDRLAALAGSWDVEGLEQLTIVFDLTAGGSVLAERWMVGDQMHSMTVYQRDADALVATHYCPQGNAPRLASAADDLADLHFRFRDAVDLDRESEEWVHDLWLRIEADGQVLRGETYRDAQEIGTESVLTLTRQS